MSNDNKKKKEPWRVIVFVLAIMYIIFLWVKKDIAQIYVSMPQEQIIPLIITTIAVSLLKVAAIAGGILLIKWMISKIKKQ